MTVGEKIQAFLTATKIKQIELENLTGMSQSRVSALKNDKNEGNNNLSYMFRIARAMRHFYPGATVDWLVDPEMDFPPLSPVDAVVLTPGEQEILRLARKLSRRQDGTIDPELRMAEIRLLGLSACDLQLGEVVPPPGQSAVEIEARERAERETRERTQVRSRRNNKGGA